MGVNKLICNGYRAVNPGIRELEEVAFDRQEDGKHKRRDRRLKANG
jgi:hypothetical protein